MAKLRIGKKVLVVFGCTSLGLGILGIFLPLLPTTPFLLLSAWLFGKSSDRLYAWLLSHKTLGPYIKSYREEKVIPLKAKIVSIALLWATITYTALWVINPMWLKVLLFAIAIGVSIHILSFKTRKRNATPKIK
jgi:uncharacterized membrane protein YbaN (DUF454 family)